MRIVTLIIALASIGSATPVARGFSRASGRAVASELAARVREIIGAGGAEVAVAYRTIDGRAELLIDADTPFHAASTP